MSRQVQIRRGTADEHSNFIGAIGEVTMDTTNKTLRVHDGETAGGTILAKRCSLFLPDYANGQSIESFPFTAPCDCMCYAATANAQITVNGQEICYFGISGSSSGASGLKWFMSAGDVAQVSSGSCVRSKYYPLKYTTLS